MLAPCPTDRPPALEQQHLEWIMSDQEIYGVQVPGPTALSRWEEEAGERRPPASASATPHSEKGAVLPPTPPHGRGAGGDEQSPRRDFHCDCGEKRWLLQAETFLPAEPRQTTLRSRLL